jgi:hypothetical protein
MYNFKLKIFLANSFKTVALTVAYFLNGTPASAWASPYPFEIHHSQKSSGLYGYHREDCQSCSNNLLTKFSSSLTSKAGEDKLTEYLDFITRANSDRSHVLKLSAHYSNAYEYPAEPRLFPATLTLVVPQTTEEDENALSLNKIKRREIQIRLTLLGFDTRGSDGIFGPRSREAIEKWQAANGFPETGYLNMHQYQTINSMSNTAYDEWKSKQPKLRRVKVCKRGAFGALVDCRFEYR